MKIVINTKKHIPVEIGELYFEISLADENIERIAKDMDEAKRKLSGLQVATISEAKEGLLDVLDKMLGEGAGEQIYNMYPSVITVSNIAKQLLEQWAEEMKHFVSNNEQVSVMKEYVAKNK